MTTTIKRIIEETGATGVKDIVFNKKKNHWVVSYKNKELSDDEFELFEDVLRFFEEESASND